jgi:hypothetical protein
MGLAMETAVNLAKREGTLNLLLKFDFMVNFYNRFDVPDTYSNPLYILNTTAPGPNNYEIEYSKSLAKKGQLGGLKSKNIKIKEL